MGTLRPMRRPLVVALAFIAVACGPRVSAENARRSLCVHMLALAPFVYPGGPIPVPVDVRDELVGALHTDAKLLSHSGQLDLAAEVEGVAARLSAEPAAGPTEGGVRPDVSLFLKDDISESERSSLESKLRVDPRIAAVTYESKEAAYQRFTELFSDQQALVSGISADSLPASFRVQLKEPGQFDAVAATYSSVSGVDKVSRGEGATVVIADIANEGERVLEEARCLPDRLTP